MIQRIFAVEVMVVVLCTSHAFIPTATQSDSGSQSHQRITERAILAVVDDLLSSSTTTARYLPDKLGILTSKSFREALRKLKEASASPDFDQTADNPTLHFNAERVVEASEHLRQLRLDVV